MSRFLLVFGLGFSVYFFMDDPRQPVYKQEDLVLSPKKFTRTILTSTKDTGPNSKILELKVPPALLPNKDAFSSIWSVYIKDDDIQVERPYTPLNGIDEEGRMQFWIKKYPQGEVGRWLHSKKEGERIEVRAPLMTWAWKEDEWDEVVMISGGTGITPFIQLFNTEICKIRPSSSTRFTLLHGSRTPGELPPSELTEPMALYAQKHPEKFRLDLFVDEDDGSKPSASLPPLNIGRISDSALEKCLGSEKTKSSRWPRLFSKQPTKEDVSTKRILFLVCGPEPMIRAVAGPYGRNYSQGPIGGVLKTLGYTSNQVYKF
ncbi:ferredoxin reductase-like protein [Crepidotus variabilis]|uniref:Ferredoxin reductase-like protein n=1 Tax=Crepidotus variabilis TaxID=179855 RepID=A0A9P6EU39_9AGAR|nr:ferredoxin reductase-like protein [Crepidotus variabilis]